MGKRSVESRIGGGFFALLPGEQAAADAVLGGKDAEALRDAVGNGDASCVRRLAPAVLAGAGRNGVTDRLELLRVQVALDARLGGWGQPLELYFALMAAEAPLSKTDADSLLPLLRAYRGLDPAPAREARVAGACGRALCRTGRPREGFRLMDEACELLEGLPNPTGDELALAQSLSGLCAVLRAEDARRLGDRDALKAAAAGYAASLRALAVLGADDPVGFDTAFGMMYYAGAFLDDGLEAESILKTVGRLRHHYEGAARENRGGAVQALDRAAVLAMSAKARLTCDGSAAGRAAAAEHAAEAVKLFGRARSAGARPDPASAYYERAALAVLEVTGAPGERR